MVVRARNGGGAAGDGLPVNDSNDFVSRFAMAHPDRITAAGDVDCVWRPEHHTAGASDRLLAEVDRTGAIGFTHYVAPENYGWLCSDDAATFFRTAADAGLVAALGISAPWFDDLRVIATANPSMPILIHHMSLPASLAALDALLALADLPNIGVKISGFDAIATNNWEYPYPASQHIFRETARAFGTRRL